MIDAAAMCVIFNPRAGKDRAAGRLARLRRRLGPHADFLPTSEPGHAVELARQAALAGYAIVAAAGGDGTVHEVANGLLLAQRPSVRFAMFPIGSANDYAHSVLHEARPTAPGLVHGVDVGLVRAPDGRQQFFVCNLGLGLNGCVTLEARKLRGLQGLALYGLATLRALWYHYRTPPMTLTLDDQPPLTMPTLMLSLMVGRREGGFVMAPHARLDDGLFDFVHAGALSRWEVLRFLPRLALFGPPSHHPKIRQGQCRSLQITSSTPLVVHLDGEFFCTPEEGITKLDVKLLPKALRVDTTWCWNGGQ